MGHTNLQFDSTAPSLTQRVRPEGRVHEMGILEKLRYLKKYLFKPNPTTTARQLSLFGDQGRIRGELRAREKETPENAITLGFVGDIMWIRNGWDQFLPAATLKKLRSLDGMVGNLETVISPAYPVREFWPDLLNFNSQPSLVQAFSRADGTSLFAALSFANNHTLDFGDRGALDTLKFLASEGIPCSGLRRDPTESTWAQFSRGEIRFGFYAATFGVNDRRRLAESRLLLETVPGLSPYKGAADLTGAMAALAEMRAAGIDIAIISLHWGHEFDFFPAPYQREVAAQLAAAGADIVMGAHSHVQQPDEILFVDGYAPELAGVTRVESTAATAGQGPRKCLVMYGLGNFTTAMYRDYCRLARLARLSFWRDPKSGRVDFSVPENLFFYNRPPGKAGGRSLEICAAEDPYRRLIEGHLGSG